jgi:hypothetical protein
LDCIFVCGEAGLYVDITQTLLINFSS